MTGVQVLAALGLAAVAAGVPGAIALRLRSDRRAAARARAARPVRLPRQLTTRALDFDEYGRPWG